MNPFRIARAMAVNAIIGFVILLLANLLGAGVALSVPVVLICAVAGIPGAILVILLAVFDVAFAAGIVLPSYL